MKAFFAQAILLGAAIAAPGEVARRAACNADNCSRAVFGTTTPGQNARGSADCSSFLKSTVSPCTVTTTATATSTSTVSTTVSTTVSVTGTTTTTTSPTTTITSTVTTTTTPTVTATTTVTSSVTTQVKNPLKKRMGDVLEKRVTSACPATTTPSNIPATYSACSGSVRFSSACSCAGVHPSTTTLATPTSTTTTTKTNTQTNTATSTITSSVTVTLTATNVQTVTATTTSTVTADTTTVTTTTTTTVAVATQTAYVPQCDNSNPNTLGTGGCSSNCYCDTAYNGGTTNQGVCNDSIACGARCNSGLDCPFGQTCIEDSSTGPCGGPTCVDTTGCSSSFNPMSKRDIAVSVNAAVNSAAMDSAPVGALMARPL